MVGIAKKLGCAPCSYEIDPGEVLLENIESLLSDRTDEQRPHPLEDIVDSVTVILQDVDEVIGIFVFAAAGE